MKIHRSTIGMSEWKLFKRLKTVKQQCVAKLQERQMVSVINLLQRQNLTCEQNANLRGIHILYRRQDRCRPCQEETACDLTSKM